MLDADAVWLATRVAAFRRLGEDETWGTNADDLAAEAEAVASLAAVPAAASRVRTWPVIADRALATVPAEALLDRVLPALASLQRQTNLPAETSPAFRWRLALLEAVAGDDADQLRAAASLAAKANDPRVELAARDVASWPSPAAVGPAAAGWSSQPTQDPDLRHFVSANPQRPALQFRRLPGETGFAATTFLLTTELPAALFDADKTGPATDVSFAAAGRLATTLGCRVPTVQEWIRAEAGSRAGQRVVPANTADASFVRAGGDDGGRFDTDDPALPLPGREHEFRGGYDDNEPAIRPSVSEDGRFVDLVGNVAEWVVRDGSGTVGVIGGSALSPPAWAVRLPHPVADPDRGWRDVGFRLAFDEPTPPVERVRRTLTAGGEAAAKLLARPMPTAKPRLADLILPAAQAERVLYLVQVPADADRRGRLGNLLRRSIASLGDERQHAVLPLGSRGVRWQEGGDEAGAAAAELTFAARPSPATATPGSTLADVFDLPDAAPTLVVLIVTDTSQSFALTRLAEQRGFVDRRDLPIWAVVMDESDQALTEAVEDLVTAHKGQTARVAADAASP